jgi:hypothetical protein
MTSASRETGAKGKLAGDDFQLVEQVLGDIMLNWSIMPCILHK